MKQWLRLHEKPADVCIFQTSMITGRIGRYEVFLPINHKNYNFREQKNTKSFYTLSMVIEIKVVIG